MTYGPYTSAWRGPAGGGGGVGGPVQLGHRGYRERHYRRTDRQGKSYRLGFFPSYFRRLSTARVRSSRRRSARQAPCSSGTTPRPLNLLLL